MQVGVITAREGQSKAKQQENSLSTGKRGVIKEARGARAEGTQWAAGRGAAGGERDKNNPSCWWVRGHQVSGFGASPPAGSTRGDELQRLSLALPVFLLFIYLASLFVFPLQTENNFPTMIPAEDGKVFPLGLVWDARACPSRCGFGCW